MKLQNIYRFFDNIFIKKVCYVSFIPKTRNQEHSFELIWFGFNFLYFKTVDESPIYLKYGARDFNIIDNPIPKGMYCYSYNDKDEFIRCQYWDKDLGRSKYNNGYCHLIDVGDWNSHIFSILWDQIKECDINLGDEMVLNSCNPTKGAVCDLGPIPSISTNMVIPYVWFR